MSEKSDATAVPCKVESEDKTFRDSMSRQASIMRMIQGPGHVDDSIRNAIQQRWAALPDDRKNYDELESQMLRMLKRAIQNLREDDSCFGWNYAMQSKQI